MALVDSSSFGHFYRRPIAAEFQRHENESEEDLVEALKSASLQQEHVLRSYSSFQSSSTRGEGAGHVISRTSWAPTVIRQKTSRLRPSWLSSTKARSLFGLQEPCFAQSCAQSSSDTFSQGSDAWSQDEKRQPRPIVKLERRPARREARRFEKELKKTQRAIQRQERDELRRHIAEAQEKARVELHDSISAQTRPEIDRPDTPSKFEIRHSWKRPLLMLGSQSGRCRHIIPMPGNFSSKSDLAAYINPTDGLPAIPQIAELPADPPPYNSTDVSDLAQTTPKAFLSRESETLSQLLLASPEGQPAVTGSSPASEGSSKPMLCDSCYAPIGLSDSYYYCKICDGGDRIVCAPCANAGRRCRHTGLEERVSSVKRTAGATAAIKAETEFRSCIELGQTMNIRDTRTAFEQHTPQSTHTHTQNCESDEVAADTTGAKDHVMAAARVEMQSFEAFQRAQSIYRQHATHGKHVTVGSSCSLPHTEQIRIMQDDNGRRAWELRRQEQEVTLREREMSLRERESVLRERQLSHREREIIAQEQYAWDLHRSHAISIQSKHAGSHVGMSKVQEATNSDLNRVRKPWPLIDTSLDHQNVVRAPDLVKKDDPGPLSNDLLDPVRKAVHSVLAGTGPAIDLSDDHVRVHGQHAGNKRKATSNGNHPRASSSCGQGAHQSSHPQTLEDIECNTEDEEDEDEGTPKRQRQSPAASVLPQRLLPCPYAKYDPTRYSEKNTSEKQYRGCSGRFLTDVSRLKQHLYRVHQRPEHYCPRCFLIFKSKEQLNDHARQKVSCRISDCQFAEKFTEDKVKELKKKRPGMSVEDNWYLIFGILFPGVAPPESPYADDMIELVPDAVDGANPPSSTLLEIFNEQLSHQQSVIAQSISREARDLINQTLAQSMAELLRRMSPTSTPLVGRTPSVLISPTDSQPRSTLRTPASSVPTTPVSTRRSNSSKRARWLSPLNTDLGSSPGVVQQMPKHYPAARCQTQASPNPVMKREQSLTEESHVSDLQVPPLGEFERLLEADVELALSDFEFGFDEVKPTADAASARRSCGTFIPVKGSTLEDLEPTITDGAVTSLKMTNSKRSLDSGYGSMHSRDRSRENNEVGFDKRTDHIQMADNPTTTFRALGSNEDLAFLDRGMYETLGQGYDDAVYDV